MQRRDPSPDGSSVVAFLAFAAAATVWIGLMASQPRPADLLASAMVMKDVAMAAPIAPPVEMADLSR
jgi:hypothetical protein